LSYGRFTSKVIFRFACKALLPAGPYPPCLLDDGCCCCVWLCCCRLLLPLPPSLCQQDGRHGCLHRWQASKRRARRRLRGQRPLGGPHIQPPARPGGVQHTRATLADGCTSTLGRVRGRGSQAAGIRYSKAQPASGTGSSRTQHAAGSMQGGHGRSAQLLQSFACNKPFFQFTAEPTV
jgi:hypothetical protein